MASKGFASRSLTRCQIEITGNALKTLNKVSYLHLILANKKALNIEFVEADNESLTVFRQSGK